MKKILLGIIVSFCLFSSCSSIQPAIELQPFPVGKELYPAVYGAVTEMYPGSKFTDIDFYNNTYTLANTIVNDGLISNQLNRFDVTIQLLPTGYVDVSFTNRFRQDSTTKVWEATESKSFLFFNWTKFAAEISNKIVEIANLPVEYDRSEKEAMADIHFVYAIMKNLTELAFNDFIENYAKGSMFVLEGIVSNVEEANKEINGVNYRYLVTMSQKLVQDDEYLPSSFNNFVYCRFYTNRDDVIRLSKTSVYRISASLVGASQGSIGNSVVLQMVASD